MSGFLRSLGLAAASIAAVLLLAEAGVRLFVPHSRWLFLVSPEDWDLDVELGWVNRANLDVTSQTPFGSSVRFRTNADGLIPFSATRAKPEGAVRIMVFGDSMVVGRFVDQSEIYTARLEQILRDRGVPADVVNAGVQGYSTDQALLLMRRWLPVYQPDVVVYGSTLNDYAGNTLSNAYSQAKPSFRIDDHGRLRLALPRLASKIRTRELRRPRSWLQLSAFYRFVQPGLAQMRGWLFGTQERILLGLEQGVYIGGAEEMDWKLYEALVAQMKKTADKAGARFVFFAHPEVGEVWEPYIEMVCRRLGVARTEYDPFAMERRLTALAQRRGIDFVAMIAEFRDRADEGPFHPAPIDAHLNSAGHALLARLLADHIAAAIGRPAADSPQTSE